MPHPGAGRTPLNRAGRAMAYRRRRALLSFPLHAPGNSRGTVQRTLARGRTSRTPHWWLTSGGQVRVQQDIPAAASHLNKRRH